MIKQNHTQQQYSSMEHLIPSEKHMQTKEVSFLKLKESQILQALGRLELEICQNRDTTNQLGLI